MEARGRPPRRRREVMSTPRTVRGEEPTSVVAGAVARRPAGSLHHPDPVRQAAMLVLSRKLRESIVIGEDIVITIVKLEGDQVRIGIAAPKAVPVHRREVYEAIAAGRGAPAGEVRATGPSPPSSRRGERPGGVDRPVGQLDGQVADPRDEARGSSGPGTGEVTAGPHRRLIP